MLTTLLLIPFVMQGQDTIRICDRVPNYFYGDMWVDQYSHFCQGSCDMRHCIWQANRLPSIVRIKTQGGTTTTANNVDMTVPFLMESSSLIA